MTATITITRAQLEVLYALAYAEAKRRMNELADGSKRTPEEYTRLRDLYVAQAQIVLTLGDILYK